MFAFHLARDASVFKKFRFQMGQILGHFLQLYSHYDFLKMSCLKKVKFDIEITSKM